MDDNVEIIRSNKGGMKLIHRGYMYTVHKKRQSGGIRWRCTQRSLHCKGSISTGNCPPKVNMPHNHIPDPHSVALARCRQFEEMADFTPFVETECDELEDSSFLSHITENNGAKNQDSPESTNQSTSSPKFKVIMKQPTLIVPKLPVPPEVDMDEVCLRWNSHHSNMKSCFPSLLQREQYVDVTLASEGKTLKCHRLILSSCSTYFDEILSGISPSQHPVIFINDVEFWVLRLLIDFMYAGEVHIEQNKLPQLLKVAQMLQIKGLTGKSMSGVDNDNSKDRVQPTQTNITEEDEPKKEHTSQSVKQPTKTLKLIPASVITAVDPLALLKPTFIEESPDSSKTKEQPKKAIVKKIRKRKSSEHEVSPPPILFRKGTKSRPNVKVPRYYHNDYEDVKVSKQEESVVEDAYDLNKVKSEPLDIEDTDVGYIHQDDSEKSSKNEEKEATPKGESAKESTIVDCVNTKGNDAVKEEDEAGKSNVK